MVAKDIKDKFRNIFLAGKEDHRTAIRGLVALIIIFGMPIYIVSIISENRRIQDEFGSGIHTHITCKSIENNNIVIDRDEKNGTWFRISHDNAAGFVEIKSRTPEGKRRWTLLYGGLICDETEL
jgi:hypothetical protein